MRHQAAAVGDRGTAQGRVGGQRLRLVNIECGAADSFLAQSARQGGLVHHRTPRGVDDHGGALHHAQRDFVDQVVGWRRALALAQQRNVQADEIRATQRFVQRGVANGGSLATQPEPEAQILYLLYGPDVVMILIRGVKTQDVHIESGALFDQSEADTSGADDGDGLSRDFVAQKRQVGMPIAPTIFAGQMFGRPEFAGERAHQEEGIFGGRFGQDVGGMGERDFVLVGIGAVDVVKSDGVLRHYLEGAFSGGENLGVDRIAQGGDQAVDTRLHLFDDQALWRSFGLGIDFQVVSLVVEEVEGVSDVAGGKNADSLAYAKCDRWGRD